MKTSAEEGEEQGEAVKAELVASMPSGLNVKSD
jgi:hypothetical protein